MNEHEIPFMNERNAQSRRSSLIYVYNTRKVIQTAKILSVGLLSYYNVKRK